MTVKVYSLRNGSKRVADAMLLFNEEDPLVNLTIVPSVSNAVVSFSTGTIDGNTCSVNIGTSVTYTVSCEGYKTVSATVVVNEDTSIAVTLEKNIAQYTLSIIPNALAFGVEINDNVLFKAAYANVYEGDTSLSFTSNTETALGSYDEGTKIYVYGSANGEPTKSGTYAIVLNGTTAATNSDKNPSVNYTFTLTENTVIEVGEYGSRFETGDSTDETIKGDSNAGGAIDDAM